MTVIPERGLRREAARPLLEREAELAALSALAESARGGDGHLVVVEGAAGIGKTRLLSEARALSSEFEVLSARAGELEGDFAFGVVRQLFEGPLASADPRTRSELLSGAAALATGLFASVPGESQAAATETTFGMLHGLYWLAANCALRRPTLLAVDDLHWADEPSLRWLGYLSKRLEGLPLLVLVATRPPEQARIPALVTEIVTDPLATVIRPATLGQESAASLAETLFGLELDAGFAAGLREASGGNPLYLVAILDAVARQQIAPTAEQAPRLVELGGEAISRGVALRLSRLSTDAAGLVRAAAILGDQTELALAAALAELDATTALDAATALVQSDLLLRENPLSFRHPVVRTAVLERIAGGERMRLHRQAAEILLGKGSLPEQAAGHLLRTIPARDSFVTTTLRSAAKRSLAQGAAGSAVTYLRRALEECAPDEAAAVLWETGVAERLVDDSSAIEHLRRARLLSDDPRQAAAIGLDLSRVLWVGGRKESIEVAAATLDDLGSADVELRQRLTASLIGGALFDPGSYPTAVERLTAIREDELQDGLGADCLLAFLAEHKMRTGRDRRDALRLVERALASGRLAEEREFALISATLTLLVAGEDEVAAAACEAGSREARRRGDLFRTAAFTDVQALAAVERGDLLAAEQHATEALELEHVHRMWPMLPYATSWSIEVAIEQGRLDAARSLLEALSQDDARETTPHAIFVLRARGKLRLAEGDPAGALADFLARGQIAGSLGIENPAFVPWRSQAAMALHRLGRVDEARALVCEELELSRRWGTPRPIGVSLRALGLVEGNAELLREAVEMLADSPARLDHARALIDLGAALRRANSRSEGRKHLREGIDLAHACGATALVTRGNEELAATGAHQRTVMLSGLESLTASERRVAQMAAEDVSNKEIAQALFVTVKTVEVHLSRVYRKLDIESRRQLAGALSAPASNVGAPQR
jgi:DNA-binding CsgD family transcriptional regulator